MVDGAIGGWELTLQELAFAAQMLVPLHLLIVPWVLLAVLVVLPRVGAG